MDADDALVVASQLKDSDRATLEQACHALADEVLRLRQVRQRAMVDADALRRLRKIEWRARRVKATGAGLILAADKIAEHILRGEISDGEEAAPHPSRMTDTPATRRSRRRAPNPDA